jgi:hypothetical protein
LHIIGNSTDQLEVEALRRRKAETPHPSMAPKGVDKSSFEVNLAKRESSLVQLDNSEVSQQQIS